MEATGYWSDLVTATTPATDAAIVFEKDNGDVGFGLFTGGGHYFKFPGGSTSGAGGATHNSIGDAVQVWISDEYNGILSDVTNYQVLSIQEFLSINDGVANPYDTNSLLGTPLEELTWSDIRPISIEDYSGFTARQGETVWGIPNAEGNRHFDSLKERVDAGALALLPENSPIPEYSNIAHEYTKIEGKAFLNFLGKSGNR